MEQPLVRDETDESLVEAFRRDPCGPDGRRAAAELLGRYQKVVYVWCYRYVGDHEKALDLAQETLLHAYQSLPSYGGRSRFSSWLFAIARNRCVSQLRRPRLPLSGEDAESVWLPAENPEDEVFERLSEARLLSLVRKILDPQEQEAIWLCYVERMPLDAITVTLGISQKSGARAVLQRARRKLRTALGRHGAHAGWSR